MSTCIELSKGALYCLLIQHFICFICLLDMTFFFVIQIHIDLTMQTPNGQ